MLREPDAVKFFNSFAEAFDTVYDEKRNYLMRWIDSRFRSDMFARFALTFTALGDLREKTILDVGCGSGPYVIEALNRGARSVTAVDPAPNMLALLRKRLETSGYEDRCFLLKGAFPEIEVGPHDYVVVMGVMDYVANAHAFLAALRPVIRLSGVISFPSTHWFRTRLRKVRYRLRNCPVHFYTEDMIQQLCSDAGFSEVKIYKIPGAGMDYHVCLKP
jgi:cyclopropane fatty-acyl-phospholipid synthase-like methyltransferase